GRLPSSRSLAGDLGVARNTVLLALDQLSSEGYVEARRGSGTYVTRDLPDLQPLRLRPGTAGRRAKPALSQRARSLGSGGHSPPRRGLLGPGEPDCADFPFDLWARLLAQTWRGPDRRLLLGQDLLGHAPLRAAIAEHLAASRGVRASANEVVIV